MVLSVDDIITKFPTKTIPTIPGEPDYASISKMVQLIYGNVTSLPTTLGGGQHGHIGLIMTPSYMPHWPAPLTTALLTQEAQLQTTLQPLHEKQQG